MASEPVGVSAEEQVRDALRYAKYTPKSIDRLIAALRSDSPESHADPHPACPVCTEDGGYEERWAIETEDGKWHRAASRRKAETAVKAWKRGRVVRLHVYPVGSDE